MTEGAGNQKSQERINYKTPEGIEVEVPIIRAGMPDLFVALTPPTAEPYIMASRTMEVKTIVDFFTERVVAVEEMRQDIQKTLGIKAYDIYGLTELSGPGVAFECSAQKGMHINEDHFVAEIIDPDTGEVLPDGAQGELVFTSLDKEAFPLLRYRTRDICTLTREKCSCGRTHVRMAKPKGRSDDMLIIRGVNVFPSQIETVLLKHGYAANYLIIVDRVNNTDTLDVQVEMTPEMFTDNLGEISARQKALVEGMKSMLGIKAKVTLVAPRTIARSEGKAVRVIDKRKI